MMCSIVPPVAKSAVLSGFGKTFSFCFQQFWIMEIKSDAIGHLGGAIGFKKMHPNQELFAPKTTRNFNLVINLFWNW